MKVIDLLNKIANGEEMPKKIYCFNREFYLKGNIYFGDTFTLMHYIQEEELNDEVEIIEEDRKINYKDAYESVLIANKMLEKENKRLQNIIKEAREYKQALVDIKEYIEEHNKQNWYLESRFIWELLDIVNKALGSDKE